MSIVKIHYFLFLAVIMLAAKPFVGFHAIKKIQSEITIGICVKAFTKRKQEYVEDSSFDVSTIQKRLANPVLALKILFSGLLNVLFPLLFKKIGQVTSGLLNAIHLSLFPPLPRYLLSGKMII